MAMIKIKPHDLSNLRRLSKPFRDFMKETKPILHAYASDSESELDQDER
jgi:hypothetical protein